MIVTGRFRSLMSRFRSLHPRVGGRLTRPTCSLGNRSMPKVLIAEDELIIADMIAEVLARNGYDICGIARSVAEVIELGDAHKPVEGIVNGKDAEPPFPPGFEVLRHPLDQHMPENPEMTAANLKITRLLRQQAALAGFGGFAFRETDLGKILKAK